MVELAASSNHLEDLRTVKTVKTLYLPYAFGLMRVETSKVFQFRN